MAPLRSTLFAVSIALVGLLHPIQAQNSTNSTGDAGDPVLDVFFIQNDSVGGPVLESQQLAGSVVTAVSFQPCSCSQDLTRDATFRTHRLQLCSWNVWALTLTQACVEIIPGQ